MPALNAVSTLCVSAGRRSHSARAMRIEPDRPREHVLREPVLTDDFGQPAGPFAAEPIELKQPILRHRIAQAEKQVGVARCVDVWNAVFVPLDFDRTAHGRFHASRKARHARWPCVSSAEKFLAFDSRRATQDVDRLARAERRRSSLVRSSMASTAVSLPRRRILWRFSRRPCRCRNTRPRFPRRA